MAASCLMLLQPITFNREASGEKLISKLKQILYSVQISKILYLIEYNTNKDELTANLPAKFLFAAIIIWGRR